MTNAIMRTGAAYIRVSTDKQEELSPDAQKRLILEYAKKNQIIISSEDIYFENGISGRKVSKRPAFQNISEPPAEIYLKPGQLNISWKTPSITEKSAGTT